MIAAFESFGFDLPAHIDGDFALAIHDPRARRLMLARNAAGIKPLFYTVRRGALFFATNLRRLIEATGGFPEIDEQHALNWLLLVPEALDSTFFAGIRSVPAGSMLVVDRGGAPRIHSWWRPDRIRPARGGDPREYEQGLRDLLDRAVRSRLSSVRTGSHLSGGLDSGTVTALAARALAERGDRLYAFTAVPSTPPQFLQQNRFVDERELASATAQCQPSVEHELVHNDALSFLAAMDMQASLELSPGINPLNTPWIYAIARRAQAIGVRSLLTGSVGNLTISYDGAALPTTLLRQARPFDLFRWMKRRRQEGASRLHLLASVIGPCLPPALLAGLRKIGGRENGDLRSVLAVSPALLARHGLTLERADRRLNHIATVRGDSVALRLKILRSADLGTHGEALRRQFGLEFSDPTGDRRVVEFCLGVPEEHFCTDGVPRSLVRNATHDLLPDIVRNERRRGLQSADWHTTLTRELPEIAAELELLKESPLANRFLDVRALRDLVANWPSASPQSGEEANALWLKLPRALSLGRFLRRYEDGSL